MRITFLLSGFPFRPVGGFRVVYEYANHLCCRGHEVTIIHSRVQTGATEPPPQRPIIARRMWRKYLHHWQATHQHITWQDIDPRVRLVYLPEILRESAYIPGDVIFATELDNVQYVLDAPLSSGRKFYLIQGWETWAAPEEAVRNTWLAPLHKVVISKWLWDLGRSFGATDIVHIPNGIDFKHFQQSKPFERPASIVSIYNYGAIKGSHDAILSISQLHAVHPEVPVTFFGTKSHGPDLPHWVRYFENPTQEFLIRKIYNEHAIYVGASWQEGWALPPAEAMACGCAFVGTDIGGFRDYAIHCQTALLSPPRDPNALFSNLLKVVEDETLLRKLQIQGHTYIQRFTWKRSTDQLEEYLQKHV